MATTNQSNQKELKNCGRFPTVMAIGFDWSGTICDDLIASHRAAWLLSKKLGFTTESDPIEWGRHPSASAKSEFEARRKEGVKALETITAEEYSAMYGKIYEDVASYPPKNRVGNVIPVAFPSAVDAIRRLHATGRFGLFVVSACPTRTLIADVSRFGLDNVFDVVLGDASDKPLAIAKVAQMMDTLPGNVAYVGDTIPDVVAAKAAGAISIGVTCGYHGETIASAHPSVVCADVFEACRLFQQ